MSRVQGKGRSANDVYMEIGTRWRITSSSRHHVTKQRFHWYFKPFKPSSSEPKSTPLLLNGNIIDAVSRHAPYGSVVTASVSTGLPPPLWTIVIPGTIPKAVDGDNSDSSPSLSPYVQDGNMHAGFFTRCFRFLVVKDCNHIGQSLEERPGGFHHERGQGACS